MEGEYSSYYERVSEGTKYRMQQRGKISDEFKAESGIRQDIILFQIVYSFCQR